MVTTVSPITNIVQNIGGEAVSVTGIVPEGTNSHTFEPAPSDAALMEDADIVFMNGLHLEEPTRELADANLADDAPLVQLGDMTIGPEEYIFDCELPRRKAATRTRTCGRTPCTRCATPRSSTDELSALDPDEASTYERNYEAFAARIDELDALVREVTASVPPENRKLLTYHDSFPYFAREYGWQIVGAVQPSDFADPTPQEVASLIDQIEAEGIPAIFGSEVFASPVLEQIAAETGRALRRRPARRRPAGRDRVTPTHSYFGLMVFDYTTFMSALGGDVDAFDEFDVGNLPGSDAEYRS